MENKLSERDQLILNQLIDSSAIDQAQYTWNEDFQRVVLGLLLCDRYFFCQSLSLIKPNYFRNEIHQNVSKILLNYFEKYKHLPSKIFIKQEVDDWLKERYAAQKDVLDAMIIRYKTEIELIYEYYTKGGIGDIIPALDSIEAVLDKVTVFARTQAVKYAFHRSLELIRSKPESDETWSKVDEIVREARLVNRQIDLGLDYYQTVEERYDRMAHSEQYLEVFSTGFDTIDRALYGGGLVRGEIGAVMAKPGVGKCFRRGTKILTYNGAIKSIEDIKVGDLVMGNDSTPRTVLNLVRGKEMMYEVKPIKGDSYFVNESHVLTLKSSMKVKLKDSRRGGQRHGLPFGKHFARVGKTNIYNISIKDYLSQSQWFKNKMKTYRSGVEFKFKRVKIDPYFLGIWLGDGTTDYSSVSNVDKEVIDCVYDIAAKRSLCVRHRDDDYYIYSSENKIRRPGRGISKNTLLNDLRYYKLLGDKHIPFIYKTNNRRIRLELLAGLMDSDGSRGNSGFDFSNKNKTLVEDVVYLARSLGFAAYMKKCIKGCQTGKKGIYWRFYISGDCSKIPVRIKRKICSPRRQIKDSLVSGITVTPVRVEDYFGFTTDGNHLFLLGDFTVVHNSVNLVNATAKNLLNNKKVLYISTEMNQDRVASRFDAVLTGVGQNNLLAFKEDVWKSLKNQTDDYEDKRRLYIKQFSSGSADMNTVRAYHAQLSMEGFRPDLVIVDYPGDMKDYPGIATWESRFRMLRDLRGFGVDENHCTLVAMQPNRSSSQLTIEEFLDEGNQGDSFNQNRVLDLFWTLNQTIHEQKAFLGRVYVAKARNGKCKFHFYIKYGYQDQTLFMREITKDNYKSAMAKAAGTSGKDDVKIDDMHIQTDSD